MKDNAGEMVERVARAITRSAIIKTDPSRDGAFVDKFIEMHWPAHVDGARAAIEAMREPTAEMKEAGFECTGDPCWPEDVGRAWCAMIGIALKPGKI